MEDLRIFDFLDTKFQETLYRSGSVYKNARQILNDNKDKIQSGKATLRVKTDATFSGLPTNGRLYPAIRVKTGAKTWLEDYAKPVLTHHKSGLGIFSEPADPIGRIHGYRYLSFLDKELKTDADEDIFKEDGTGVLQLESDITDPDAIQKIMDGRYKTVSVGFVPSNLSCTICNKDWKMGEPCEHIPNNRYTKSKSSDNFSVSKKGKLCLLRAGDISYLEQSFVNVPAASKAGVTSFEVLNDALDKMEIGSFPSACVLVDSLQIEDLSFTGVSTKDKEVIEILDKKDPEDWVTEEDVRPPVIPTGGSKESTPTDSEEDEDNELNDDEFSYTHILKGLRDSEQLDYEILEKEDSITKEDVNQIIQTFDDAKLSTAQRKSLKTKSFCGPNRSFPVPDCSHVRSALRLLNRAKVSSATRESIRACVNRKNNSMGCGVNKDMVKATSTSENKDSKTDAVVPCIACQETKDTMVPVTELATAKVRITELEDKYKILVEENSKLATRVKESLVQRLFDLRVKNAHPISKDITDASKIQEAMSKLMERETSSLEDSIKDEVAWGASRTLPIERGSVVSPVQVDKSKDAAPAIAALKPKSKQIEQTQKTYKSQVAEMF